MAHLYAAGVGDVDRPRYRRVVGLKGGSLLEYGDPEGHPALLAAARMSAVVSRLSPVKAAHAVPEASVDLILGFIERDLMKDTGSVADPGLQVNRHGIAHGIFAGFETRDIALKYLILLDSLAFVVFHDRLVASPL